MKLVKYYAWERFFEKHVSGWAGWLGGGVGQRSNQLSEMACPPAAMPPFSAAFATHLPTPGCPPPPTPTQISDMRAKEKKLMFWNVVIKVINVTMVFGVPPMVLFAVLVSGGCALFWPCTLCCTALGLGTAVAGLLVSRSTQQHSCPANALPHRCLMS